MENQEGDNTPQAVKRRLPRDIKLKLAKVARLAVLANLFVISCLVLLDMHNSLLFFPVFSV